MNTFRFKKELFKNEVKVMQLIQNENGVTLHDFLKEENNFYILMEYCTSNLKDYLDIREMISKALLSTLKKSSRLQQIPK